MNQETVGPTDVEELRAMIALPELGECRICSICAIVCGSKFPPNIMPGSFAVGPCPGCGRHTGIAKITDWNFKDHSLNAPSSIEEPRSGDDEDLQAKRPPDTTPFQSIGDLSTRVLSVTKAKMEPNP